MSTDHAELRFSANVSVLFTERPFLERFGAAAAAGFRAVEFWWPAGEDVAALAASVREASVEVAVFNLDGGDLAAGDRGLVNDPQHEQRFRANLREALELARLIRCQRLNVLVGIERPDASREEQIDLARRNVAVAARAAAPYGISVLIEATNTIDNGPYLLDRTEAAAAFADSVEEPNVALQYDVYHMQRMEGNLAATIRRFARQIGHVQIADSPGRGEPGTGEIPFPCVFESLLAVGYSGYVGAEYIPTTDTTEASLGWLGQHQSGSRRSPRR